MYYAKLSTYVHMGTKTFNPVDNRFTNQGNQEIRHTQKQLVELCSEDKFIFFRTRAVLSRNIYQTAVKVKNYRHKYCQKVFCKMRLHFLDTRCKGAARLKIKNKWKSDQLDIF